MTHPAPQSAAPGCPPRLLAIIDALGPDAPLQPQLRAALSETAPAFEYPQNRPDLIANQFLAWRNRDDAPAALLMQIVSGSGIDADHPRYIPLMMAAALGGVRSPLPFHNHHHTREVTYLAALLGADLDADARAELLIAACIHDFSHDGQGNRRFERHTPMRLENRALLNAEPYLKAAGLVDDAWQRIRVMVLATDVSKGTAGGVSPAEWLRRAYSGGSEDGCPDALRPLFADRTLARYAALLEDADLGTSAGMPYAFARRMTALIAEETRVLSPTPETLIGFIEHICHGAFITPEAAALFGDNLDILRRLANEEAADTIYIWS